MKIIRILKAPGYNPPDHWPMWLSQWAHQLFLWGVISFERYTSIQDWAYGSPPAVKEL